MKAYYNLSLALVLFFSIAGFSQVGINTVTPAASAALDVVSTNSGVLVPRMTMVQRNAIAVPATGLLIYQTDNTPTFYYYNGVAWIAIGSAGWNISVLAQVRPLRGCT